MRLKMSSRRPANPNRFPPIGSDHFIKLFKIRTAAVDFQASREKECKVLSCFDNNELDNSLKKHFQRQSSSGKKKIMDILFGRFHAWNFVEARDQLVFYHVFRAKRFLDALTLHGLVRDKILPSTEEGLARLALTWDNERRRPPVEEVCIKLLYGISTVCDGMAMYGEAAADDEETDDEETTRLLGAYKTFLAL
jgi:hypothetical protein